MLLYLQDVFDFCGLSEQEICALAKHEHISQVSAAALGSSLLESKEGIGDIERFMREDIEDAESHRQPVKVQGLERVLAQRKG